MRMERGMVVGDVYQEDGHLVLDWAQETALIIDF